MSKAKERQKRVAEDVVLRGKSYTEAALEAGYSRRVAHLGPKAYMAASPGMRDAFLKAALKAEMNVETLKAVSKHRLVNDIVTGKDSGVTRQVEILARFKEHDWLVRNTDVQIGVFASIAGEDPKASAEVDEITASLPPESKE